MTRRAGTAHAGRRGATAPRGRAGTTVTARPLPAARAVATDAPLHRATVSANPSFAARKATANPTPSARMGTANPTHGVKTATGSPTRNERTATASRSCVGRMTTANPTPNARMGIVSPTPAGMRVIASPLHAGRTEIANPILVATTLTASLGQARNSVDLAPVRAAMTRVAPVMIASRAGPNVRRRTVLARIGVPTHPVMVRNPGQDLVRNPGRGAMAPHPMAGSPGPGATDRRRTARAVRSPVAGPARVLARGPATGRRDRADRRAARSRAEAGRGAASRHARAAEPYLVRISLPARVMRSW